MRKFYFIRHGQTNWNLEGRMQGIADIPLNDTGILQAQKSADKLAAAPIDLIVSSPLERAHETARIVNRNRNLPITLDNNIMERSFGSFEGLNTAKMKEKHGIKPEDSITLILPEDAEQWPETKERSNQAICNWLGKVTDKTILFVSHAAFFRALVENLTGQHMEAKNAAVYLFTENNNHWSVTML